MIDRFIERYIERVFDIGTKVFMTVIVIGLMVLVIRNIFF